MGRFKVNRLAARLLIFTWLYGVTLPVVDQSHADQIDVACGDRGWGHGGPGSLLLEADSRDDNGHCEVCHLQRTFRSAFVAAADIAPVVGHAAATFTPELAAHSALYLEHLSSRAPPRL